MNKLFLKKFAEQKYLKNEFIKGGSSSPSLCGPVLVLGVVFALSLSKKYI